ncbi:MAG: hypothetical protein E6G97_02995 [Alphaproteobacteria bacterium]|nr:MAG: hypothetical protein E6G97_02995 [Alphaproteobacteria bacterium]
MPVIYVQTTGSQQVGFGNAQPIPGLSLTLPEGVGESALVILNVPNPNTYNEGTQYASGGWFGISVDGTTLPTVASFSYAIERNTQGAGRFPTTLVVAVPLAGKPQTVVALWRSLGMSLYIDTPASLSALI